MADSPSYQEAHREGMAAHRDGKSQDENQYDRGTEAYDGWNDGWLDAEYSQDEDRAA